jgi:hypothetical protein
MAIPVAARTTDGDRTLLERDEQLAALEAALARVTRTSRGGLAFVAGEAGVGKTELLRRFAGLARGARMLWATCDPLSAPRPLGPFLDLADGLGGDVARQVAAGAQPHEVAAALRRELGGPSPAVLVLEDAQWADEATLDVVRLVARRIEAVPALLIVSYRDEQVARHHPLRLLLGELPAHRTRIELPALSHAAVATLSADAGAGVDVDELYARTAGNPFFVTEVLAAEAARIPGTVRDAVLARAARLSDAGRRLLDAASVIPQRAELWLLEALGALAGSALEDCLVSGMLRADGPGVCFRHELARIAIEESLPPDRAVALHAGALTALADPPGGGADLARIAHHAEAAGDTAAVLHFAPAAARHAAALGAHREAEAQYARALRHAGEGAPELRAELLEGFAAECYLTDMRAVAEDALTEAAALHRARRDARGVGRVLEFRSRISSCAGRTAESRADLQEALAVLAEVPPGIELARVYAGFAGDGMLSDDVAATIAWGTRGIELAEQVGDTETLARCLDYVGVMELTREDEAGREKLERGLALARRAGLAPEAGRAYINLIAAYSRICRWDRVEAYLGPGIEYCREQGLEAWEACLLAGKADARLARGHWAEAVGIASALLARPKDHATPRFDALRVLALARARRGEPDVWPLLGELLEVSRTAGELQMLGPAASARAEAAWLEGRPDAIDAETAAAFALAVEMAEPWMATELAVWRVRAGLPVELPAELAAGPHAAELAGDHGAAAEAWRARGARPARQRRRAAAARGARRAARAGCPARRRHRRPAPAVGRGAQRHHGPACPDPGERGRPDRARARRPRAAGRRPDQRRDRRQARPVGEDRAPPRLLDPAQARRPQPRPGRHARRPPRLALSRVSGVSAAAAAGAGR